MKAEIKQIKEKLEVINEKQQELVEALRAAQKEERIERQKAIYPVADLAHSLLCRWNHTDGCGYGYENNDTEGYEHQRWVKAVEELVERKFTLEQIKESLAQLKQVKAKCPEFFSIIEQLKRH